jgi:CSLREA domain-containing protein
MPKRADEMRRLVLVLKLPCGFVSKIISALMVLGLVAGVAGAASAATITVDTLDDGLDGVCSLRAAITAANLDTVPAGSTCTSGNGRDRIVFSVTGFLTLNEALPEMLGDLDIAGGGSQDLVLDAGGAGSVLVAAGTGISISGLTLTGGKAPFGGGLYVREGAAVTVSEIEVYSNVASEGGGGIASRGALDISKSTISNNITDGSGGGIYATSDLVISDSLVTDNTAGSGAATAIVGGGIHAGRNISATSVTVSSNRATGGREAGAGGIYAAGEVVLNGGRIEGNMVNTGVDVPTRNVGGGILSASLQMTDATIADNIARSSATSGGTGSGVYVSADVTILRSTISDNNTDDASSRISGAVLLAGATTASRLTNSTISGNRARNGAFYLADPASSLSVLNTTITGNSALAGILSAGTVTLANTIISANDTDCRTLAAGSFVSTGYNIDSDGSCALSAATDQPSADPLLGPLADNGGPTFTPALLGGSPAIDAGDDSQCPETDQRGNSRREDGNLDGAVACDIGAFELQAWDLRIEGLSIDGLASGNTLTLGTQYRAVLRIGNVGRGEIDAIVATIAIPTIIDVVEVPPQCSAMDLLLTCEIGTLAGDKIAELSFSIRAATIGSTIVAATVTGTLDDTNLDNNVAQLSFDIVEASANVNDGAGGNNDNGNNDNSLVKKNPDLNHVPSGGGALPPMMIATLLLMALMLERRLPLTTHRLG